MSKSIEIRIEVEREFVINRDDKSETTAYCRACSRRTQMVSIDESALLSGATSRSIFEQIESGSLHYTETCEGLPLVCGNSLGEMLRLK